MRKLILEVQISVDGFIADVYGNTGWMQWNWGPDWKWSKPLQKYHTELTRSADCILLSSQMAQEGFINHWKDVAKQTTGPQFEFANHIVNTPKIVFSSKLNKSIEISGGWDNTDIKDGEIVAEIEHLKNQAGSNIIVYGGAGFVSSLIANHLIDEFHLLINPVAIGNGLPIFGSLDAPAQLHLVDAIPFEFGMVALHYQLKKNS
jgi:dihydrofolate reductase